MVGWAPPTTSGGFDWTEGGRCPPSIQKACFTTVVGQGPAHFASEVYANSAIPNRCPQVSGDISVFQSIAVVGATGAVGQLDSSMLEEREFPFQQIKFLASARSAGTKIKFAGKKHTVEELKPEAFDGRRPGDRQHARRRGQGLRALGRRAGLRGGRRERLLADGPQGAAGGAGSESRGHRRSTRASSPAPTVRPRRWSWR